MKAFLVTILLILSLPVLATQGEMRRLVERTNGAMYGGHVPEGYRSVALTTIQPRGGLQKFLRDTTKVKQRSWREFVMTGGEYDHVSLAERRVIAAKPLETMEVAALLEIEEVYAIYKGNKLIGYFIQITDHVQGAIYQDGAWFDAFFDENLNLIEANDRSA